MNLLRSSFSVLLTRVWGAFVGVVVSIIIARTLGPEGKGVYSLLLLFPTLLFTFGNFGLHIANVYLFGKRKADIRMLASNSLWGTIMFGALSIVVFTLLYPILSQHILQGIPRGYVFAVVGSVPFMMANAYFGNLLLALKRVKTYNLITTVQLTLLLVTVALLLVVFKVGLVATVVAAVLNVVFGGVLMVWFVRRRVQFGLRWHKQLFKDAFAYGLKGYFANAIQFLNYRLDILLVSFFLDATSVGIYSVAVNFAEVLWYVPTSIGTILFPHVATTTDAVANVVTARTTRQTLLLMAFASVGVAIASPWLIPWWFGPEFLPSVNALLILLPGVLLFSVAKIIGNDFSGRGLVITNGIVSALALVINSLLNIVLIPKYGINGASLASSISYTVATIALVVLFARRARLPVSRVLLPENGDFLHIWRSVSKRSSQ
jgi:O-antigen/teichoic acid export membrane protein